jgi:hypothetical protein
MIERFAVRFNDRNFLALTEDFVFPLPVQVEDQLMVIHTADQMSTALAAYHAQNIAEDLTPSRPQIIAIDIPRNGRFRLWVDWVYGEGAQKDQVRTKNLYFCSVFGNRLQIEMVQYLRIAATGPMMETVFPQRRIA